MMIARRLAAAAFENPGGAPSPLALTVPQLEAFAPAVSAAAPKPLGLFELAKKHPLAAAVFCGCLKDSTCDLMTQKATSNDPWDWRRTAVFATFGATFVGAWQYWLFSVAVPRIAPSSASFAAAPLRQKLKDSAGLAGIALFVAVENLFNQPFAHFPTLYTIKHALTHAGASPQESLSKGLEETRDGFWQDNLNSCAVWVPATLINGLFVPVALRVPFMTLTGCGWTTFMSYTKGAPAADADSVDPVKEAYAKSRRIPRAPEVAAAVQNQVDGLFQSPWARNPFMDLVGCGLAAFAAQHMTLPTEAERPSMPLTPEVLKKIEAASAEAEEGDTIAVASHAEPVSRPSLLSLFDECEGDDLKKQA